MPDLDLEDLAIFARVVERRGFASAARELGTPTSTVSRAIARLEASSAVRLVQRTTRTMKPTAEGYELYAAVAPALLTLRSAARALEPAAQRPKGRLRVTAPNDLCSGFLAEVIVQFAERHPQVQLEFAVTNQLANLVEEGFDIAVRASAKLSDSLLVAKKLGVVEHRLYASPKYLQDHGAPRKLDELEQHRCIVFRAKDLRRTWTLRSARGDADVPVRGRIGGDDLGFVRAMVLAGAGVGILPHLNAAADEASGRLVRVLPDYHARGASLYLVYPSSQNLPARVTAFRDFVSEAFASWEKARR